MKAVLRREKARNRSYHAGKPDVHPASRGTPQDHAHPAPSPPSGKTGPDPGAAPGPPGTVLVRAGGLRKMKPAAPSMRSAPTDAQRRELSKSVEFLKIGSLQQMLWPRDADAVYRFNCDIYS